LTPPPGREAEQAAPAMDAASGAAPAPPGAARVLSIAIPVVLSNVTTPLQGAFDVAVIGSLGSATMLAAVGLGAQIFALLIGVFNFLQMGSSGLAAQALGRATARASPTRCCGR
jgi:MATE family multidrug resistance protein